MIDSARLSLSLLLISVSGSCCLHGSCIHQPIFCCSSQSPDTCPYPVLHVILPISGLLINGYSVHQPIFCCSSHSPDTCPYPVLHVILPISGLLINVYSVHQPIFCCSSHSPDTCPYPVLHVILPISRLLINGYFVHQPIFCCSSHPPDTCPHPVLHISRSSAVRPTLQTLAPIQSSTSADLLLFVPLSRHLLPSSPPHQPIFCCSSHSPDTCSHPVLHISRSSDVRPLSRHLLPSSPPHQPIF